MADRKPQRGNDAKQAAEEAAPKRDATLNLGGGQDLTAAAAKDDRVWKVAVLVGDRQRWRTCQGGHLLAEVVELGGGEELTRSPAQAVAEIRAKYGAETGASLGSDENQDGVRWLVEAIVAKADDSFCDPGDIDVSQICVRPECGVPVGTADVGEWLRRATSGVSGRGRVLGRAEIEEMFTAAQREDARRREERERRRRERDRQRRQKAKKGATQKTGAADGAPSGRKTAKKKARTSGK